MRILRVYSRVTVQCKLLLSPTSPRYMPTLRKYPVFFVIIFCAVAPFILRCRSRQSVPFISIWHSIHFQIYSSSDSLPSSNASFSFLIALLIFLFFVTFFFPFFLFLLVMYPLSIRAASTSSNLDTTFYISNFFFILLGNLTHLK